MIGCGEQASPHLVIDVVIQATGADDQGRAAPCPGHLARGYDGTGHIGVPASGAAGGRFELGSVNGGSGPGTAGSREQHAEKICARAS